MRTDLFIFNFQIDHILASDFYFDLSPCGGVFFFTCCHALLEYFQDLKPNAEMCLKQSVSACLAFSLAVWAAAALQL